MPYSFAGRTLPMTVRVCRSLVWTQASFVILAGVFVVFAATVFGSSNAIPFHGDTLSGTGAAALGLVYVGAGLLLAYLAFELGRLSPWARVAIVSMEVFLAVLLLFRSFDLSLSSVINLGLEAAIVGLLFVNETRRAFEGTSADVPRPGPVAGV